MAARPHRARRPRSPGGRGYDVRLGFIGVAVTLGAWEAVVRVGLVSDKNLPPASSVVAALGRLLVKSTFWTALGQSLTAAALGFAIAVAVAVPLGILMGTSQRLRAALNPTVQFLRPVPGVALVPAAILLWGPTPSSDVFLVAFGCIWPMLVQTLLGVLGVPRTAIMTARIFGLSLPERVRWVLVPAALPFVATGVQIATTLALIIAISVELIVGSPGLGATIREAQDALNLDDMYALILGAGAAGLGVHLLVDAVESRVLRWQPSRARGEAS